MDCLTLGISVFCFTASQHQAPLMKNPKDEIIVTSHLSNLPEDTESFTC